MPPIRTAAFATGRAWGAGADLFAACDLRARRPMPRSRFPGSAFGIVLGTRRLTEIVGWDRARPLVTEGVMLEAPGARAAGLVEGSWRTIRRNGWPGVSRRRWSRAKRWPRCGRQRGPITGRRTWPRCLP